MKVYVITGASKGLGLAIASQLLQKENHIICLSRSENEDLKKLAAERNTSYTFVPIDLAKCEAIEPVFTSVLSDLELTSLNEITLINNAGIVNPIKPIEKSIPKEQAVNIGVNLLAPITITSIFVKVTQELPIKKTIVNVSSGAANRSVYGWSLYCSAKAGLDRFTQTVGLEQQERAYPVKVISFAPGIVDTAMQAEIRSSKEDDFKDVNTFTKYFENGDLLDPHFVSKKLLNLINSDFSNGGLYSVRDL
jgi:benzil reductase ((S)-benzoin forming)